MCCSTDVCIIFIMRLTPSTSRFPSQFNSLITFALGNKHVSQLNRKPKNNVNRQAIDARA
jgi:hypothetical protein